MAYFLEAYTKHLSYLGQCESNIKSVITDFEIIFLKFCLGGNNRFVAQLGKAKTANLIQIVTLAFKLSHEEANQRFNRERRIRKCSDTVESMVSII